MGGVAHDCCSDPDCVACVCEACAVAGVRAERLVRLQNIAQHLKKEKQSPREILLDEAKRLICSDRNATYGPPSQDFERTAAIWSQLFDRQFTAHEVAMAMIALKLSRLVWRPEHMDSWTDIAGYAACGHECVEEGK